MVIVVAIALAIAAIQLKPFQENNKRVEKKEGKKP
jgi:DNA-binding transcriptional regulator of glucitol operon